MKYVVGAFLGILIVIVASVAFIALSTGPELSVRVTAPDTVSTASPFALEILASNPHSEVVTLDSVDIDRFVFESFDVVSVSPPPRDTMHLPVLDQQSWSFLRPVPPGETVGVQFELRAKARGSHQIPVDGCKAYQDCSRTLITVTASDPGS